MVLILARLSSRGKLEEKKEDVGMATDWIANELYPPKKMNKMKNIREKTGSDVLDTIGLRRWFTAKRPHRCGHG